MVVASLLLPARINRGPNVVVSLLYLASIVVTVLGESWTYYILGSVVEIGLLLGIVRSAWTWRELSCQGLRGARTLADADQTRSDGHRSANGQPR